MKSFVGPSIRGGRPLDPVLQRREAAPEGTDTVDAVVLTANASKAHAIPTGAEIVNFSANGDFYAKFAVGTGTTAIPSTDIADGSSPMLNPATRIIPEGATYIYFIAPATTIITLEFWGD
jgi:hypothetical protein